MKKISKKLLALLLAVVMVFGVVPNIFPAAEEVKASETTDTVDEFAGYDVHYDFENADLSQMNLTSTQLSNSAPYEAIEGQVDKPIAEHWFTGTSGYKTSTSIKNNGMKPKNDNGTANVKQTMIPVMSGVEDFEMNVDLYASTGFGVAIGSKNVFPDAGTNTGIRVYFYNGWIRLVGTFNASSLRVSGTAYSTKWVDTGKSSLDFHPSATSFTNMYTNRQKETLNIRVHDDMLVLWLDSSNTVLSIELTDTSVMDTVSLIGNFYNGGGGFSSVDVKKYDQMYDFENADLSKLTLTSTQLSNSSPYGVISGQENKALSDHWFTGTSGYTTTTSIKNNGLKPKNTTNDSKYSMIPIMSGVKDFELKFDLYACTDFGVAIGTKNVVPDAGTNTGARIYFAGGYMRLVGTFDASSLKVTGTSYSWGWNASGKDLNFNPKSTTSNTNIYTNRQLETLNIKVQGNLLTLSMDSCDTVLSIRLTDTSSMNTVSLFGKYYNNGGGIRAVGLRRSKTQYDFEKADLSLIDLKSTQLNNSSPYNVL